MRLVSLTSMYLSTATGGAITLYNNVEPPPPGWEIHHTRPWIRPLHIASFANTRQWTCFDRGLSLPTWTGRRAQNAVNAINEQLIWRSVALQWRALVHAQDANAVLFTPQNRADMLCTLEVVRHGCRAPSVWLMDDYFTTSEMRRVLEELAARVKLWWAISPGMARALEMELGVHAHVLNNSVVFDEEWVAPDEKPAGAPLRLCYAGAINSYYAGVFQDLVAALKDCDVEIDVYSAYDPPQAPAGRVRVQGKGTLPMAEMRRVMRSYDALLLLSSFEERHHRIAATSLASKVADYLWAGRPLLTVGPRYSENVRYTLANGLGLTVEELPGPAAEAAVQRLREDAEVRKALGRSAYEHGKAHHNAEVNRARFWDELVRRASAG